MVYFTLTIAYALHPVASGCFNAVSVQVALQEAMSAFQSVMVRHRRLIPSPRSASRTGNAKNADISNSSKSSTSCVQPASAQPLLMEVSRSASYQYQSNSCCSIFTVFFPSNNVCSIFPDVRLVPACPAAPSKL